VSGDFYDFVPLDRQRLGIVIADVTDKGMPAALFMAHTRSVLRASLLGQPAPSDALTAANRLVAADSANGMFVTLCYVQITAEGQAIWVNAGHNPPLLFRAASRTFTELSRHGLPLGIDAEAVFAQGALQLQPGDTIVLYTDGLSEGADDARREYGTERARQAIAAAADRDANGILAALLDSHTRFLGSAAPSDDVTVVVLRRAASG
jgi:sigma-B regulation protein RsbU (phosphoserine phosphatase)